MQNGFLGAYFATASGLDDRQSVRIYDVNAEGGATAAYAAAVADGAEFVVGPLLKRNVASLANDILVPVPVLTLNYLPETMASPPGMYQFALSPEDEAAAAARQLTLSWGVIPAIGIRTHDEILPGVEMIAELSRQGLATTGNRVVITAGLPLGESKTTNAIRVAVID